jgi:riboflavin biosynthesis pyrimidine reductase
MFMEAGVVDRIYLNVEPKIFGKGLTLFNKPVSRDLSLTSVEKLSDNVLFLEYKVL